MLSCTKVASGFFEPVVVERHKGVIQPVIVPSQEVQALLGMSGHTRPATLPQPSAATNGVEVAPERAIGVIHPNRPALRSAHDQQRYDAAAIMGKFNGSRMVLPLIAVGFLGPRTFRSRGECWLSLPAIAHPITQRVCPAGVFPQGIAVVGVVYYLVAAVQGVASGIRVGCDANLGEGLGKSSTRAIAHRLF